MDEGLFSDLAHVLSSKVRLMNAHDISSVVAAFSTIEYAHKSLFKALQRQTKATLKSFSPLQLARSIHGFGIAGVEDPSLYRQLWDEVMKKRKDLHAKNIVEILIGLAEAEFVPESAMTLLQDVDVAQWLDANDCIQALHALARLPQLESKAFRGEVLKVIRKKSQGWWRLEINDMADLMEAMVSLKIEDTILLKLSLGQLPRLLSKRSSAGAFLRLWGALSELPPPGRQRIMEELHRNMRLRKAVEANIQQAVSGIRRLIDEDADAANNAADAALKGSSQLMIASASLGWDLQLQDLVDIITSLLPVSSMESRSYRELAWASYELGLQDLARQCLEICSPNGPNGPNFVELDGFDPSSFHGARSAQVSDHFATWPSPFDKVEEVSQALLQMDLPHEKHLRISNLDVDLRLQQDTLVFVLAPKHLTTSGQPLGSTVARRRQLQALGFDCVEISYHEVDAAEKAGNLQELLRTSISSAFEKWQRKIQPFLRCFSDQKPPFGAGFPG